MLTKIILITFIIELLGAISFFIFMYDSNQSIDYQMFSALFHSVTSFCNAGFALFTDNLVSYNTNYGVSITVMLLIILWWNRILCY